MTTRLLTLVVLLVTCGTVLAAGKPKVTSNSTISTNSTKTVTPTVVETPTNKTKTEPQPTNTTKTEPQPTITTKTEPQPTNTTKTEPQPTKPKLDGEKAHYYNYLYQGQYWGDLVEDAELCKTGKKQSPIDLQYEEIKVSNKMEINGYGYGNFVQYKSNIQLPLYEIPVTEGEFILNLQDGKKQLFKPIHFSFKAPSEHTIRGRHFDLEMQILHHYKGTDEQLGAVISIFLDRGSEDGEESVLLKSIFQVLDSGLQGTIRLQDFLQNVDFGSYWNYDGSLTTPPCQEGIKWTVIQDVQPISAAQLKRITSKLADDPNFASGGGNNRVLQPLNGRDVYFSASVSALTTYTALATLSAVLLF